MAIRATCIKMSKEMETMTRPLIRIPYGEVTRDPADF